MELYSKIIGTGKGFPERTMTNKEFESIVDTNEEWIRTRTGIETRRICDPNKGESTLSMAIEASQNAIDMAKISSSDIDGVIVGTMTQESIMPTTAIQLQATLGVGRNAFAYDLSASCSGFIYSLSMADAMIRSGQSKTILVVGADALSTVTNWKDRTTCVLFGDGAGAVVLTRSQDKNHRVIGTKIAADGDLMPILGVPHGGSRVPPYVPEYDNDQHKIQMVGKEVFKNAVRYMGDMSKAILDENKLTLEDVDQFIFHQANVRILEMCTKQLGLDPNKVFINVQKYGNTSAATIPVGLDEVYRGGKVKSGDLVLVAAFGGGVTYGAGLVRL